MAFYNRVDDTVETCGSEVAGSEQEDNVSIAKAGAGRTVLVVVLAGWDYASSCETSSCSYPNGRITTGGWGLSSRPSR
jgi:hypothetical protein